MGEYFRIMEEAENDAVLGALQVQDRPPYPPHFLLILYPPSAHPLILPPPSSYYISPAHMPHITPALISLT